MATRPHIGSGIRRLIMRRRKPVEPVIDDSAYPIGAIVKKHKHYWGVFEQYKLNGERVLKLISLFKQYGLALSHASNIHQYALDNWKIHNEIKHRRPAQPKRINKRLD